MDTVKKEKLSDKAIKKILVKPFTICSLDKTIKLLDQKDKNIICKNTYNIASPANSIVATENGLCIGCQNGQILYMRGNEDFITLYEHSDNVCSMDCNGEYLLSGSWDHEAVLYRIKSPDKNTSRFDKNDGKAVSNSENLIDNENDGKTVSDSGNLIDNENSSSTLCRDKLQLNSESGSNILKNIVASMTHISQNRTKNVAKRSFTHPGSVWCTKIVSNEKFITGCADGIIRIFENFTIIKEISSHIPPVRGIIIEEEFIYSVDNHGNLHKTNQAGKLLRCRPTKEFLFCICKYMDYIVTGGEKGIIFILNKDLEIVYKIKLDSPTVWDLKQAGNVLYAATSDGFLYSICLTGSVINKKCSEEAELKNSEKTDKSETPGTNGVVSEKETQQKTKDGIFTSGGVRYKVENDQVYIENGGTWDLIGETENTYDHSFPVTLDNKEYTLSFNKNDNVHDVASKFIQQNKLNPQFHSDIVNHIQTNFKKDTLFKKYEGINLDGLVRTIGEHKIIDLLRKI